jgi:hypothetical protein
MKGWRCDAVRNEVKMGVLEWGEMMIQEGWKGIIARRKKQEAKKQKRLPHA